MKFAKSAELNFCSEIFRIAKMIEKRQRPLYELENLNRTPINGQFYLEELTQVPLTRRTVYKIDKILDKASKAAIYSIWSVGDFIRWILIPVPGIEREICKKIQNTFTCRCSVPLRLICFRIIRSSYSRPRWRDP